MVDDISYKVMLQTVLSHFLRSCPHNNNTTPKIAWSIEEIKSDKCWGVIPYKQETYHIVTIPQRGPAMHYSVLFFINFYIWTPL